MTERVCFTAGTTPRDVIDRLALEQCPEGFSMRIADRWEWLALAGAWNEGIDAHLEALTVRSSADAHTGEVLVHPAELGTLLRRLWEAYERDEGDPELAERNETVGSAAGQLRSAIIDSLGIEEV